MVQFERPDDEGREKEDEGERGMTTIDFWSYWRPKRPIVSLAGKLYGSVRYMFFTRDMKDGTYIRVYTNIAEMKKLLKDNNMPDWSQFSYNYQGEDVNVREYIHREDKTEDYQLHIRVWDFGTYCLVKAHVEPCPIENLYEHLKGIGYDAEEGIDRAERIISKRFETEIVAVEDGEIKDV
jgi:hypothetical protein